ncbi:MAG TPA: hypothetical protein VKY85_13730 [Candidatus Angelobacter sp.]|nr:hypothetical protein [Candidatus Angelobacter sp.]
MGVKSYFIAALVFVLSGSSVPQVVQSEGEPDLTGQVQMQVVKTSVLSYSSSKLVLGLTLAISSKRDLTVEQIVLGGLRINGLPLYAAPVKQRIQLHSGDKTLLPDPLPVTVYLRDLDSVSPLEEAISNGHTTLDGTAYATIRLSPLATVMLLSKRVDVAMSLHEDVLPFTVPGGQIGKNASLAVLHATDKALHAISGAVAGGRNRASGFRHETMQQYAPHLLLAYAHFELRDPQGKTTAVRWCGVALATAPDLLLVPREAVEPWRFDAEIADAIHSKRLSLNAASYDLWLWPVSASVLKPNKELNVDTAIRLSNRQISLVKMPDHDEHKILALEDSGKTQRISVEKRESSSDLALLRVAKPLTNFSPLQVAGDPGAAAWDSVALFRFRDGLRGSSAEPELIVVPAKRNGNRIELGELVDSSTFGSPIVAPEGVIGIVQDETSGVAWPEAVRVLKLDKFEAAKK